MDRPYGRRVLRFDGPFGAEGCGGGFAASKKGRGWRHRLRPPVGGRLCRRVVDGKGS